MGLKSFLDNIIPNELKGNAGKILGVATAGYLGYKYAPSIYSAAKNFIGQPAKQLPGYPGGLGMERATGMFAIAEKYKDTKAGKFVKGFGKQLAGKAMEGESDADARARYEAERARMEAAIRNRNYGMPSIRQLPSVGNFSVSQARVQQTGKNAELGGYETIEEFAANNPLEAEKYLQRTTKGYIK